MNYTPLEFRDLPSTATPITAASLNHMQTQYTAALAELNRFDLSEARISYGATLGLNDRYVMQRAFMCEALDNAWFVSRTIAGTESDREGALVSRISKPGSSPRAASGSGVLDSMELVDAGHGDDAFVEHDPLTGDVFLWSSFRDWRYPSNDPQHHNVVRIPWGSGKYTYADVEMYRVSSLSGRSVRMNFDEYNGIVSVRRGGSVTGTRAMSAYRLSDLKASATLPPAVASGTVTLPTGYGPVQDHAYLHSTREWFFLYGASTGPAALVSYSEDGTVRSFRDLEHLVNLDSFGNPESFHEPEGIVVHHTPLGTPSVIFGLATGGVYARKSNLYTASMNGSISSALSMLSGWLPPDTSDWISSKTAAISLTPGLTTPSSAPIKVSLSGGRVWLRGRVEGALSGEVNVMQLSETFRPSFTRESKCVIQGGTTAGSTVIRCEIKTSGIVTVYLPSGATPTWIDFDETSFYLTD